MKDLPEVEEARRIATALHATEARLNDLHDARTQSMAHLHALGISWAEIGRIYSITPQAAMYATGHAKRTGREKPSGAKKA